MPRKRIDRFLNEAIVSFSAWLKSNHWRGKEHECVNLFAHKFLFENIAPGAAIECPTQICIECPLKQPNGYTNKAARKDLVIWEHPLQTTWSDTWEPIHSPKAVMEWKVFFRKRVPSKIFDTHDEEWIVAYTREHPDRLGYVVSVDLVSQESRVFWKQAKEGKFSEFKCA